MKPKQVKKLSLNKETIRNLGTVLARNEQDRVKGGTDQNANGTGTTQVPIYC